MNTYIVSISNKYLNNIIRYNIKIKKIKKIDNNYLLYLDIKNYQKIIKYKKIFDIQLIDVKGFIKYKKIFKNNIIFFVMFILMILYIILLSNLIFQINVKTSNKEIEELIRNELSKNNISLYKFVKTFKEKEIIKNKILNNNKDKLEWLEITKHGSCYEINVEERIIKQIDEDKTPQDIVSLKNAIILKIDAKSGSIVKKLNDYVKKGEVIVSGNITHKEEVVNKVKADAKIYGETWYKVHISYPFTYYDKTYTKEVSKRLSFNVFNKEIFIGKKFKNEEIDEIKLLYNKFIPIKFSLLNAKEIVVIDDLYTVDEAYEEGLKFAKEKLLNELPKDSKILNQKKLKLIVNNSTIDIDIFFKVYENITDVKRIEE